MTSEPNPPPESRSSSDDETSEAVPDTRSVRTAWSWKVSDPAANPALGLRYEPGNWGDVLKGTWAVLLTRWLCRTRSSTSTLRVLDPFAGAPTYPLAPGAARRLVWLGDSPFTAAQRTLIDQDEIASTGELARRVAAETGRRISFDVYDVAADRRARWQGTPDARVLELDSGDDALRDVETAAAYDLVLVDPYDFFTRWSQLLPTIGAIARRTITLVYLYNKAPRGSGHGRNYARLRARLEALADLQTLIGRVPSDAVLPRAWHEVIALAPREADASWKPELVAATRKLAARISDAGAIEDR